MTNDKTIESNNNPDFKKALMNMLLQRKDSVFVHFDGRHPACQLPLKLKLKPQVVMQYGLNMPVPIPDLTVDDKGITATLSFAGKPQTTFVPWEAVFVILGDDAKGIVFYEAMPAEMKREVSEDTKRDLARRLDQAPSSPHKNGSQRQQPKKVMVKPSHLRLVK